MSDIGTQSIAQWYLARLRSLASIKAQTENLTPMSLVQSDKRLIQEMVSKASASQSAQSEQVLLQIEKHQQQNNEATQLFIAAFIGFALVMAAALF